MYATCKPSVITEASCPVRWSQHAEFWPSLPVTGRVRRYAYDESSAGRKRLSLDPDKAEAPGCTKHASSSGLSHGLLAASCASCYRTTGFSLLSGAEGPKHVFEVLVCRLAQ